VGGGSGGGCYFVGVVVGEIVGFCVVVGCLLCLFFGLRCRPPLNASVAVEDCADRPVARGSCFHGNRFWKPIRPRAGILVLGGARAPCRPPVLLTSFGLGARPTCPLSSTRALVLVPSPTSAVTCSIGSRRSFRPPCGTRTRPAFTRPRAPSLRGRPSSRARRVRCISPAAPSPRDARSSSGLLDAASAHVCSSARAPAGGPRAGRWSRKLCLRDRRAASFVDARSFIPSSSARRP